MYRNIQRPTLMFSRTFYLTKDENITVRHVSNDNLPKSAIENDQLFQLLLLIMTLDLFDFFSKTPTPFHFCKHVSSLLENAGYTRLREEDEWSSIPDKFFVTRRGRALIAVNKTDLSCGVIFGSHSDSPGIRVLDERVSEGYTQLVVTSYDSALFTTWLDRDLRLVGRVIFRRDGRLVAKIVDGKRPFAFIPSCAVHLIGKSVAPELKMPDHFHAVVGLAGRPRLLPELASLAGCEIADIVSYDCNLVPVEPLCTVGVNDEFICGAKIDDMICGYSITRAFLNAEKPKKGLVMLAVFDNEELGSGSDCGARSNFITSVLERIGCAKNFFAHSFFASADVIHGRNPNVHKWDSLDSSLCLGQGVAYDWGVDGSFMAHPDSVSRLEEITKREGIPFTPVVSLNSTRGGSTIGPHVTAITGVPTIDFSLPVIAMHSAGEVTAISDVENLVKLYSAIIEHYFECE